MIVSHLALIIPIVLVNGILGVFKFYFLIFLDHFKPVTLQNFWNVNSQDKCSVSMSNYSFFGGVGINIWILIVVCTRESIKSHAYQLLFKKCIKQELKGLIHTELRHWDLPQVALSQVSMCFHHVTELLVVFFGFTFEDLLQNCNDMLVEI